MAVAYGLAHGRTTPPASFFWLALLYPIWGLAQQFVLCPLLYQNLNTLKLGRILATAASAVLFGLAHAPDWTLCGLTAASAVIWVRVYDRWPNLWCQGVSHGLLGALAYSYILGRDPWAELVTNLTPLN
ncbi:MAG TPA: CPBP family glutamic-type intramembrane protease [Blastocatellia bacterium]|nr:CPBP family glutamic-type intramembrane protease [Blastocatellia bacterium]